MKTIGVIPNIYKDEGLKVSRLVADKLLDMGAKVNMPAGSAKLLSLGNTSMDEDEVYKNSEAIICLGGDGSFLKVAKKAYVVNVPILGINLGSLGFLTEIEKGDMDKALESLINDDFAVEERMMLETVIHTPKKVIECEAALNDAVISRGALSRILHLKTYINDNFAYAFPGDGLIVSSPTGSTAYSLSAGGPIIEPDLDMIILTPICPHILYSRTFVTSGDRVVKIFVDENYGHDAMVTIDGQKGYQIRGGYCIEVRKSPHSVKMIRIGSRNFFNILRAKMYERGEYFKG